MFKFQVKKYLALDRVPEKREICKEILLTYNIEVPVFALTFEELAEYHNILKSGDRFSEAQFLTRRAAFFTCTLVVSSNNETA